MNDKPVEWHGAWLGTNSGQRIDLLNPKSDTITIEDIATGLSNACRFNGQLKNGILLQNTPSR